MKKLTKNPLQLTEHDEAVLLAKYLDLLVEQKKVRRFSHIAQETFTRNWGTKNKNKAEGVRPGVPDYIIITKDYELLFIELKRVKGGVVSEAQRGWIADLNAMGMPIHAHISYGFDEAKKVIDYHLA